MRADMHTHSESSHDSTCKIEDMALAQLQKGTTIFAVTDHFDTDSYQAYDVFTPIKTAYDTVQTLNARYGDRLLLLSGVEISEGFWHPAQYQKIHDLVNYDVIIGSVHLVQFGELSYAYSKIDFSALPEETVLAYLDAYFDDVLTMLATIDFDILAHLTCPLRYINGKYHLGVTLSRYEEKIERILRTIIEKGIALEVNASYSEAPGSYMPPMEILQKYRALGGRLITVGSDAHIPENASANLDGALAAIKAAGFDTVTFFKGRRPFPVEPPAKRVTRMEQLYDTASADPGNREALRTLSDYMESGLWRLDYERDERGEFPPDLKRGVLSQDGLYDLLTEHA